MKGRIKFHSAKIFSKKFLIIKKSMMDQEVLFDSHQTLKMLS